MTWQAGLLALCLGLMLAASSSAASLRSCGDVGGEGVIPTDIASYGDSCQTAKRLADRVSKVAQAPFNGCVALTGTRIRLIKPCLRLGYSCRAIRRLGTSGMRVGCRRGDRWVNWSLK